MLKKAGAVAAAAAGLVMLGAPAMASATPRGGEPTNQIGFININDVNFLNDACIAPWQWNGSVIGAGDVLTVAHTVPYTACSGNTSSND